VTTLPAPPTGQSVSTITDVSATVTWDAVTGATSYNVYLRDSGGAVINTFTSATNSYTLSGLTPSTQYSVSVSAVNAGGEGNQSATSSFTTFGVLDASASFVSADYTNGYTLTFDLSGTGEFPLLASSYTVTGVDNPTITIPQANRIIVGGLSEYTEYSFSISITGYVGTAVTSSQRTLDRTSPGYPNITVDVSDSKLTLTWPNIVDSGSPMANYYIFDTSGESNTANALYTLTASSTNTHVITGLTNGTSYTYYVSAKDAAGNLGAPATVLGTPAVPPSAPTIISVVAGNNQIIVNWTAGYNGGSIETAWQVSTDNGASYSTVVNSFSSIITDLTNETEYTVVVRAVNAAGNGTPSTSRTVTPVASTTTYVSNIISQVSSSAISKSEFKANLAALATQNGPSAIQAGSTNLSTLVTPAPGVTLPTMATTILAVASGNSLTVNASTDLSNNAVYIPAAVNLTIGSTPYAVTFPTANKMSIGATQYSRGDIVPLHRNYSIAGFSSVILLPVPSDPQSLVATPGVSQIALSWSAPSDFGGAVSVTYRVDVPSRAPVTGITGTNYTVTGLTSGQAYTITVRAVNPNGAGSSASVSATPTAPSGGPNVPCFFGNAPVLTNSGYRRMDSLRAGDKVLTPAGTEATIERVKVTRCAASPATNPYVIPKGRFGAERSVLISPNHKVVTQAGLVEARHLGLEQETRDGELIYYNLELTDQAHMVVGGVAVESLATIKRMVLTMDQFKAVLQQKYGGVNTETVLANIKRTCRFLADGRVEVPVLRK
jgi:titin